jgi:hypothetical protein
MANQREEDRAMSKCMCVGSLTAKPFRILAAVIPVLLAGGPGQANAQTLTYLHQFSSVTWFDDLPV